MSVLVIAPGGSGPSVLSEPLWYPMAGQGLGLIGWSGDDLRDPRTVWRTQRSVRTVVGFLARNIAQVGLHAFKADASGDRERLKSQHPLSQHLGTPAATTTPYNLLHRLAIDICLWDRYAALKVRDDRGRLTLVRLPPHLWRFGRDALERPTHIMVGTSDLIDLSACFWLDGYPVSGDSTPMESITDLLNEERESGRYRRELWANGARVNGWIERPADAPMWSRQARENFRQSWRSAYTSSGGQPGTRAGGTPILEEGMQFHEAGGVTPVDAQQLEARKLSVSEVAAYYYVPPVFVGILDNATYSNVTAYREILYSDTLGPWFMEVGQAFNARLVPEFKDPDIFVEFNVAEKLRLAFEDQARIMQAAVGAPVMSRNEARRRMNLPRREGADDLIVPLNVAPDPQKGTQ